MAEKPLISVIVPVYNVAAYLDECLESIIRQTYTNLEIILVDDGSTDESGNKCDEWVAKDSRVKVIHKENGGQASARNMGLKEAAGLYIGYVDSDDYIDETMYETLLDIMEQNAADIVECQYSLVGGTEPNQETYTNQVYTYTGREVCNKMLENIPTQPMITVSIWNCLYKAEVAKKTMFEEGVYYEDVMYSYRVLWGLDKVIFYDKPLYCYRIRNGSTTNVKLSSKHIKDAINSTTLLYDFYHKQGTKEEIALVRSNLLEYILRMRFLCPDELKAEYDELTQLIKKYNFGYRDKSQRGFKSWLRYIVYRYFDRGYRQVHLRERK